MIKLEIALSLFVIFCFVFIAFCLLMINRNEWVFKARTGVLHERGHEVYSALPSYETMLYTFWVWDVNKFLPKEHCEESTNG